MECGRTILHFIGFSTRKGKGGKFNDVEMSVNKQGESVLRSPQVFTDRSVRVYPNIKTETP